MPKLKGMRFATAVIERHKRRETSVEEAIIEMYLAGVSTRRIEDVGEILWGAGVSAGTVSNLDDKAFKSVDEWRYRPLTREYPYVYVDGIYLKRSWGDSYENVAVMVAIGVNEDGYREVIRCAEGFTESAECWRDFLSRLKSRGLRGVRMFTGDKAAGMVGSIAEVFPKAKYQRCTVWCNCFEHIDEQTPTLSGSDAEAPPHCLRRYFPARRPRAVKRRRPVWRRYLTPFPSINAHPSICSARRAR